MAGRPKTVFNVEELEKLGGMQCTQKEVAAWFGCTPMTINRRFKAEPKLAEAFETGQEKGRISLRRTQFRIAETNAGMAIFLGKNYLGQTDKTETAISGDLTITNDLMDKIGNGRRAPVKD